VLRVNFLRLGLDMIFAVKHEWNFFTEESKRCETMSRTENDSIKLLNNPERAAELIATRILP
jgi:hypothetical protein